MAASRVTLVCEDVAAGASFFRDVLALPVRQRDAHQVDVELGEVTATLTARADDAAAERAPARAGSDEDPGDGRAVILEVQVDDVREALRDLRRRGATVLLGPVLTEWDTESAFVAGPDGVVVELYRPRPRRSR